MSDKKTKEPQVETGLTLTGADFGKKLVEAAVGEHKEQMKKKVIGLVQEILVYIEAQRDEKARCDKNLVTLQGKITALENGEFSINRAGTITFNDESLQKSTVQGPNTCSNCGFGRSGVTPGVRYP